MTRPHPARLPRAASACLLAAWIAAALIPIARADDPAPEKPPTQTPTPRAPAGRFFAVEQPITSELVERIEAATGALVSQAAKEGRRPVLVFEFKPGKTPKSGPAMDLARLITKLTGEKTVAYIPEPLAGFAAIPALACGEIVMGPDATLGPITPEGQAPDPVVRESLRVLARDAGRDPGLLLGMHDPEADLHAVRTADRQLHFVLADDLPAFEKTEKILDDQPAWEFGRRGGLSAARAREIGVARNLADDRAAVAAAYDLPASEDPTLGREAVPVWIRVEGPIDTIKEHYLRRRIAQARQEKANLIFFEFDSTGGLDVPADRLADEIARAKDMKTVAYVQDATGVAALVALACDDIIFHKDGRMGDLHQIQAGDGPAQDLDPQQFAGLLGRAESLAKAKGHPSAVARAMVDPQVEVVEARDNNTGAVGPVAREQVRAEPNRFVEQGTLKSAGEVLTVTGDKAKAFHLALAVVEDVEELKSFYGLAGKAIRVERPTWVDALVATLNTRWMSSLLLFVGFFMLVVELKLPGIGLPAITSALAFLLFFWSRYLSGTADSLEIMLFLVGLVCLALELFVFPGFGVFGMSGILLILVSVVMASHTFIWPTRDYEYRQLSQTLGQITLSIVAVTAGAVVLGRYFPSLPLFNKMVLMPEPIGGAPDPLEKPAPDPDAPLHFLIGESGRTTTTLRPTGKARFGELLVDVTADGFFIEPDSLVEVVEVHGSRVTVRKV